MDERVSTPTRVEAVMADIRGRIASRRLAPGARLPSVRDLAETAGVSKSTVVEAYERLVADGAILSRRGSGFFVAGVTRPLTIRSFRPDLNLRILGMRVHVVGRAFKVFVDIVTCATGL